MRRWMRPAASLVVVCAMFIVSTSSETAASGVANPWPLVVQTTEVPSSFVVVIALEFEAPNPEARVTEIAERYEAEVIFSVTEARTYLLRLPAADGSDRLAVLQALRAEAGVDFAHQART